MSFIVYNIHLKNNKYSIITGVFLYILSSNDPNSLILHLKFFPVLVVIFPFYR